jgi:hypothetical protein
MTARSDEDGLVVLLALEVIVVGVIDRSTGAVEREVAVVVVAGLTVDEPLILDQMEHTKKTCQSNG